MLSSLFADRGIEFLKSVYMKDIVYYRIGGPADFLVYPKTTEQLAFVTGTLNDNDVNYLIMGNGSNLLISDRGFRGCIIDMSKYFTNIVFDGEVCISAEAGCTMSSIQNYAEKLSLRGFEKLGGIPGTLGGALVMNAGCYGTETGDLIKDVTVVSDGREEVIHASELNFKYRTSNLKGKIVLSARIQLEKGTKEDIAAERDRYSEIRRSKQPLNYPSCGSVFKRPENCFAGELIEKAGLKGKRYGGAQISDKHAGFIINTGTASSTDVLKLIQIAKEEVFRQFNVKLEEEVILIGFDKGDGYENG